MSTINFEINLPTTNYCISVMHWKFFPLENANIYEVLEQFKTLPTEYKSAGEKFTGVFHSEDAIWKFYRKELIEMRLNFLVQPSSPTKQQYIFNKRLRKQKQMSTPSCKKRIWKHYVSYGSRTCSQHMRIINN